jgi:hypothetical protein
MGPSRSQRSDQPRGRLPYHSPKLEFYGHVSELTRGSFSTMNDADMTKTKDVKKNFASYGASNDPWFGP